MVFSITDMEKRVATLQRRRDVLVAGDGPELHFLRGAYIQDLNEALGIIAELSGRLSAAEELLAERRRPSPPERIPDREAPPRGFGGSDDG
jgi:hypothetical protein